MLLSIALRLIHCNEFTSYEDLSIAYHTLMIASQQQQQEGGVILPKHHQNIIQKTLKTLQVLPCLKSIDSSFPPSQLPLAISSSSTITSPSIHPQPSQSSASSSSSPSPPSQSSNSNSTVFIPHYRIGEYVWCQVGGWGYWPGKIVEQTDETFVIQFLNNEYEFVPFNQVSKIMKSFLHYFSTYTTVSTCRLEGFEAATAVALEFYVKKKLISQDVINEITKKLSSTERWSARMKRISHVIQEYLHELSSIEIFSNFTKILHKQQKQLLDERKRQVEELEREQSLRDLLQQQIYTRTEEEKMKIFITEAINKINLMTNGKKLTVKEMVRHLEQTSPYLQDSHESHVDGRKKRNKKEKVKEDHEEDDDNEKEDENEMERRLIQKRKLRERNSSSSSNTSGTSRSKKPSNSSSSSNNNSSRQHLSPTTPTPMIQSLREESDQFETNLLLGLLSSFLTSLDRTGTGTGPSTSASRSSIYTPSLYLPIYSVLHLINSSISSECLVFILLHDLPYFLYQMFLSRYSPRTSLYQDPMTGNTFYHLIAQYSTSSKMIELTYEYYSRTITHSNTHLLRNSSHHTAIDLACLHGSEKILEYLCRISGNESSFLNSIINSTDEESESPVLMCTYHDRSLKCLEYLMKSLHPSTLQCLLSSALHRAISHNAVEVGKFLLLKNSFLPSSSPSSSPSSTPALALALTPTGNNPRSWLKGAHLISWCSDMSLGRERYRIILDIREIQHCKLIYLAQNQDQHQHTTSSSTTPIPTPPHRPGSETKRNVRKKMKKSDPPPAEIVKEVRECHSPPTRRSSRKSIPVVPSYSLSIKRKNKRKLETLKPVPTENRVVVAIEDDDDESEEEEKKEKEEDNRKQRSSNRVEAMSSREIGPLLIEKSDWQITPYMSDFLHSLPPGSDEIFPHFIYSTEPYWGNDSDDDHSPASDQRMSLQQQHVDNTSNGIVGTDCGTSYQCCCRCVGDCINNPTCPCIMRNGQRSPYSKDGLFDFSKGKIYECGPECSCHQKNCSLRLTQHGVSLPLVVCRVGSKGYGVMATKVLLKGTFVCAYVGERVSEENLQKQEERKIEALKLAHTPLSATSRDILSSEEMMMKGYVTYAFQIHDGTDIVNIDSEYIGNVARFFNHSCNPNLRPVKVICYRNGHSYLTMAFFALRRIEPGEELTWKYVSGVTRKSGQRCYCGSSNCVGYL